MFQAKNAAVQAFYYQETSFIFNHTCTFLPKSEEVVLNYLYMKTTHKREFSLTIYFVHFFFLVKYVSGSKALDNKPIAIINIISTLSISKQFIQLFKSLVS